MSNYYIPRHIDHNAWVVINAAIRGYPRLYAELTAYTDDIINGTPIKQESVKTTSAGNPTETKALKLSATRYTEMERKCNAVRKCYSMLDEAYCKVISFRFWGVKSEMEALEKAKRGGRIRGLPFESSFFPTVGDKADYSSVQVKRIIRAFILAVGEELGEI